MKKNKIISALLLVFLLTACEKVKENLQITGLEISTPIEDVEVPFVGIKDLVIPQISVGLNFDVDAYIKEKVPGASIKNVREARLKSFVVEKQESSFVGDLKVFKNVEVWVESPDFSIQKAAWVEDNANGEIIQLEVDKNLDLIDFLKSKEGKKIILKDIKVGESALTEFTLKLTPVWDVTVGI
ncbi:MAG: hypothetical protein Q4G08_08880 [Capnocytophaga sp.]|nr:hypothetical protein [Capnocytophaga sp.]